MACILTELIHLPFDYMVPYYFPLSWKVQLIFEHVKNILYCVRAERTFCSLTTCPTRHLLSYLEDLEGELKNAIFYFDSCFPCTVNMDQTVIFEFEHDLFLLHKQILNSTNSYLEANGMYCCCIESKALMSQLRM